MFSVTERRRRSVIEMRERRRMAIRSFRRSSQDTDTITAVDCKENPDTCIAINCNITALGTASRDAIQLHINGVIDERFYVVSLFASALERGMQS